MLLKHTPLVILALALAIFQFGNAAIVPLYGLFAVTGKAANGPGFVATIVVIAQGTMGHCVPRRHAHRREAQLLAVDPGIVPGAAAAGIFRLLPDGMVGCRPPSRFSMASASALQSVAVPGMIARSMYSTGRVNLAQGAVITIQSAGAAVSPALGGWIAEWIGYSPAFLVLGAMGLLAAALWIVSRDVIKQD